MLKFFAGGVKQQKINTNIFVKYTYVEGEFFNSNACALHAIKHNCSLSTIRRYVNSGSVNGQYCTTFYEYILRHI